MHAALLAERADFASWAAAPDRLVAAMDLPTPVDLPLALGRPEP